MIERIIDLIDKSGITAYKLTSDLGLSSGTISEWKKGKSKPSTDAIIKIADYFNVTTDYLLKGEQNTQKERRSGEMNEKAKESLDKLKILFRLTLDYPMNVSVVYESINIEIKDFDHFCEVCDKLDDPANNVDFKESHKKLYLPENIAEKYRKLDVTKELLQQWYKGNYADNPPKLRQLFKMLNNAKTPQAKANSNSGYAKILVTFEQAIEDYAFYKNLDINQLAIIAAPLGDDEQELLDTFRILDKKGKNAVQYKAYSENDRMAAEEAAKEKFA